MFVGTFEHALDGKGRVVLPSQFCNGLAGTGYLAKYERCLGLWTQEGFDEIVLRLRQKVREGEVSMNALRSLTGNAVQVEPDAQGRILIPQKLREYAGLDREVAVVGLGDRIEIWSSTRWVEVDSQADDSLLSAVLEHGI